jgi:hypothetical protein
LTAGVLSGCQVARAGARCRTTDFGRDNTYVLQCRKGRWVRIMTIHDYLILLKRINDSKKPSTTTTTAPKPVGQNPTPSSWNLVGDVGLLNQNAADGVNDGIGHAAAIIGNTAYIGGSFNQITNNTSTLNRANVAAFDITTGQPTSFVADTNGIVNALATDGTHLFIGGHFSTVNGASHANFAAVDPTTGAVDGAWNYNFSDTVQTMAVSNSKLYVGGSFSSVSGNGRGRAAAFDLSSGALDAFNPVVTGTTTVGTTARGAVDAITAEADDSAVYIGGYYTTVGGTASTYISKLTNTGTLVPMTWTGLAEPAMDLTIETPGHLVAAIAGVGSNGDRVSRYNTLTGGLDWTTGTYCVGDAQAVATHNGGVFAGFHGKCNNDATNHLLKMTEADGTVHPTFKPVFDGFWGVFDIAASSGAVVIAGQFEHVNGALHKGFAIFAPAP